MTNDRSHFRAPVLRASATPMLDRLRGDTGPLVGLPARATVRPGLIETIFASSSERAIMRQRDAAAAAVESAQIDAAVEVAVARTEDAKALALKGQQVESARGHFELEERMQHDTNDANRNDAQIVAQLTLDVTTAEKALLDDVQALTASGRIAPDRAELVAEIIRRGTDSVIDAGLTLRDMIYESRSRQIDRSLSRPRDRS